MGTSKEIFEQLCLSAKTNCVLKIKFRNERNPLITAVEKVVNERILLKPTCLYGYKIKRRTVTLTDIEAVARYKTSFDNPLFVKLRFVRNHISAIRNDFAIDQPSGFPRHAHH